MSRTVVTLVTGLLASNGLPRLGTMMLGNFMPECGVVARLSNASENEIPDIVILFLRLTIGGTTESHALLKP